MRGRLTAAIAVALVATLAGGLATAATKKSEPSAKACVTAHHDLRLLTGKHCPKGQHATTLAGVAATPTPLRDVVARAAGPTDIPAGGGVEKGIVGLYNLPAGSWVLTADATVVNFTPADIVRCEIIIGTDVVTNFATQVGTSATTVANVNDIAAVNETKRFTAFVECEHDKAAAADGSVYIDSGAVMEARQTASLTGTTG